MRKIPARSVRAKAATTEEMEETNVDCEMSFTKDEKIKLVNLVEDYPIIHDATTPRIGAKKCWIEIAANLGRDHRNCQYRWRKIKDYYLRRKHKGMKMIHYLDEHLKFLDKSRPSNRVSTKPSNKEAVEDKNAPSSDNDREQLLEVHEEQQSTSDADTSRKDNDSLTAMKIIKVETDDYFVQEMDWNNAPKPGEDHVDMFLKSIAVQMKSFPDHLINEAKLQILQIVVELDNKRALNVGYYNSEL